MMQENVDVVVIGGGPAGTTAGGALAERGHRVLLLEKEAHPRFHIGESLLPCNLPILERLGVLQAVHEIGVPKPGADFTTAGSTVQSFAFARAIGDTPPHAYQVKRAEFDQLLFENCRRLGVDAREQHQVVDVVREEGAFRVRFTDAAGVARQAHARFVIDASGRDGLLARKQGARKRNPRHASAAIFGHFAGVERRTGELAGNISVYWFEHGWLWMIPLRGDVMSVGAVCSPAYLRERDCDLRAFLCQTVAQVPDAARRMAHAESVSPVSATGNYSYRAGRLHGDGYLLVGDAYAFIDPVFSSGVYLAMNGALASVDAVEAWLAGDRAGYRAACRRYRHVVDRKLGAFSWFIYRFTTPVMRDLFEAPRNDWQVEQAVIAMLVGNGDGSAAIRARLRLFKLIYCLYGLKRVPGSLRAWWTRRRGARVAFEDETILS